MTVRVRFAPSPTGYLHIGGARTALYNYLYAKAQGGTLVLRVEDTDLERSRKEFEESQISDLKWMGIEYDEGPDKPGEYGPYRQSERTEIYLKHAQELIDKGLAYYCFCSDEELEEMKEKAQREGRPPHYEGKWRNPEFFEEASARLAAGEKGTIRFKVPEKSYVLNDKVRGRVVFPENMVGDFVLVRSNGLPVYNFCCVVDDYLMKITHVIRGEDHLSNTLRQLMIYEALDAPLPEFAHVSLLIGKDRQKLSKRHGATSVSFYREESYLPQTMVNYLSLLGWSHPEEKDIFDLQDLVRVFNLDRFSKSPAIYDTEKLKWVNGQHIKQLSAEQLQHEVAPFVPDDHPYFKQTDEWKQSALALFKDQMEFFSDFSKRLDENIFSDEVEETEKLKEILSWETTPVIANYLSEQLSNYEHAHVSEEDFSSWMDHLKKEKKIKGKNLFMGIRISLTARDHGPELKDLIPLTPIAVLKNRLKKIQSHL